MTHIISSPFSLRRGGQKGWCRRTRHIPSQKPTRHHTATHYLPLYVVVRYFVTEEEEEEEEALVMVEVVVVVAGQEGGGPFSHPTTLFIFKVEESDIGVVA